MESYETWCLEASEEAGMRRALRQEAQGNKDKDADEEGEKFVLVMEREKAQRLAEVIDEMQKQGGI